MATTLTLKNIPDHLYERLKSSAALHHRSLNSEAIVCLENALFPARITPEERLERARHLRAAMPSATYQVEDIDTFKRQGRA